ncbi:MAG: (S)-2-hydroxyglutarate dehydrogenase, partial [Actinomycetota bacterium]
MDRADVAVIGAGIVGLATARALLLAEPSLDVVVLDKEPGIARHQSGRNSNVLHSGIYYRPDSMKAATVNAGRLALLELCREHGIAHEVCGKVIVATESDEVPRLEALRERAEAQGIVAERVNARDLEPDVVDAPALHVPSAGIVDFVGVCEAIAEEIGNLGGRIRLASPVTSMRDGVLRVPDGELRVRRVVGCAGLQSDRIARLAGAPDTGIRIVPFRGEFHTVVGSSAALVRNLVYP